MTNFVRLRVNALYIAAAVVVVALGLVVALGVSVAKVLVPTSGQPSCACASPAPSPLEIASIHEGAVVAKLGTGHH